jgi:hypothetical protein
MTVQLPPSEQACLLNSSAQCNRIWVSKADGLRLTHFQTLNQEPTSKEGDQAIGVAQLGAPAAYEQCARGCLGPR